MTTGIVYECKWIEERVFSVMHDYPIELPTDSSERLKKYQEIVGGYLDIVNVGDTDLICNDEGLLLGLPLNLKAKRLYGVDIAGTIIAVPSE